MSIAGIAKLLLGSDEEAVTRLRRAIEINRNHPIAHFYLAAALAHLDRLEEARSAVQAGLVLIPGWTVRRSAPARLATIRPIWRSTSASLKACSRPGYPND
jgi:tetratricopeptide (TPR) repeat protein